MQEPTHILAGAIIERSAQSKCGRRVIGLALTAVAACAITSLIDKLAHFDSKSSQTAFHNPYWIVFTVSVLAVTALLVFLWWRKHRAWEKVLIATAAFLSHGMLDKLANFTYHPPNADFHDPFWVGYHLCVLIVTILFVCRWWPRFKLGVTFATLPDLDWVLLKSQDFFHFTIPFYRSPHMHRLLSVLVDATPPFSDLKIPSHRYQHWACLYEVALIAVLLLILRFLSKPNQTSKT
jgi:hypothetical protein